MMKVKMENNQALLQVCIDSKEQLIFKNHFLRPLA